MTKYIVVIEETVAQEFKITAKSAEDALKEAKKKYEEGKIVLEPGEVQHKQMRVIRSDSEASEWCEF